MAATGVGAGDLIAASVSGANFGMIVLWAALFGAIIKFGLNEGIARWQLATGETLMEGWAEKIGKWASVIFVIYLFIWSFIVGGALISACGLAAHAVFPQGSVSVWGICHSIMALVLVWWGRYQWFEKTMKIFIGMMFVLILICALSVHPDWIDVFISSITPRIPKGSTKYLLGVIGGVGGSVTLLNYGYWIREKGWHGKEYKKYVSVDLGVAYLLTGLFGLGVMIVSAGVQPEVVKGPQMVLAVANRLEEIVGEGGKWVFLLGFWGAVFSSMLGVWQGVPYIFEDFVRIWRRNKTQPSSKKIGNHSLVYHLYLLYLAFPTMLLLLFKKPVWIVVIYSITGAMFMPFLALTLLYMNNRKEWVGSLKNRWHTNALLVLSLAIFGYLLWSEIERRFLNGF